MVGGTSSSGGKRNRRSPGKSIGSHSVYIVLMGDVSPKCVCFAMARYISMKQNGLKGRNSGTGIPAGWSGRLLLRSVQKSSS